MKLTKKEIDYLINCIDIAESETKILPTDKNLSNLYNRLKNYSNYDYKQK